MSIEPLRLNDEMLASYVVAQQDTPSRRVCRLIGSPSPSVTEALAKTRLRFSLIPQSTSRIQFTH